MSGDDLSAAYASGDVFMMPSESETLGFVALEAMASGLPVVAVAAGGLTDILTNPGVTGLPCCCPCTLTSSCADYC
jgi:sulfoquinovosyltransferase